MVEERESEGEGDEEIEEDGVGVERPEGSVSEGEEVDDNRDEEIEGSKRVGEGNVDGDDEREGSEREVDENEEKDEEVSEGEEDPGKVCEGEQDVGCLNAEEKVETKFVDVDDLPSDNKGTPEDERTTRRHSRRIRNVDEAPPVNQLQKLRLQDEDGSDNDVSQVQEPPAGTKDVSPEVSEERYEAERKRKGKEEAKAHKKEASSSLKSGGD